MSKQVLGFLLLIVINLDSYAYGNLGIISGHDAVRGQFPYQVSIQILCDLGSKCLPDCGGIIINDRWILTAGTCVYRFEIDTIVVAGLLRVSDFDDKTQIAGVEKSIIHPNYAVNATVIMQNNLALWKLNTSLVFNEYVQPAKLPEEGAIVTGVATLSGWGKSGNTHSIFPDVLQTVDVPIISAEECVKELAKFPDRTLDFKFNDTLNICTGHAAGNASTCHGDNGGPLTQNGILVGVISTTISPCGVPGFPDLHSRVSTYLSWIKETTGN